jgi:transcriptional regulator with XRE-family HTH domain
MWLNSVFCEYPFPPFPATNHYSEYRDASRISMNSQQCRAARGLLQWSQRQLADASGVGLSTVAEFEIDRREPRDGNLTTIRRALEDAGVEFIPAKSGKGVGVRLREDKQQ